VRYYPYGTDRPGSGNPATDYRFTGQRQEGTIGLYDYGARFYDPLLGRFLSADTVVPEPGNPQALNRYAYVLNNPLKYTDPSGHKYDVPDEEDEEQPVEPAGWWPWGGEGGGGGGGGGDGGGGGGVVLVILTALQKAGEKAVEVVNSIGWKATEWFLQHPRLARALGILPPDTADRVVGRLRLSPDIAKTFRDGKYTARVLTEDTIVYRAEGTPMGRWFGTVRPDSSAAAEHLYNVAEYGNDLLEVATYRIPAGTVVFEGGVAGGSGWQYFISNPKTWGVEFLLKTPLPQYGF